MKNRKQETVYTIEREFLAKITVTEFINRIIQNYIKENLED